MSRRRLKRKYKIIFSSIGIGMLMLLITLTTVLSLRCCGRGGRIPWQTEAGESALGKHSGIVWSDTLRNESSQSPELAGMDADIDRFMRRWDINGISFAVSRNDSLLFAKGYGIADRIAGTHVEPTTQMRIASVSKLITAAAVMKLVEERKLSLADRPFAPGGVLEHAGLLPEEYDCRIPDITVDHLLRHMGGFTLGAGDPMFTTADIIKAKHLDGAPDSRQLASIVLGRRLGFTPGSGRKYSNFGYMLLSLIIEQASGKTYWEYVDSALLRPAGAYAFLPATNYFKDRNLRETRYYGPDTVTVEEYNGSGRMVERVYGGSNVRGLMGAGGWTTTASDLARFVAAIDGHPGVKDILSAASIRQMTAFNPDEKVALGWSDITKEGRWTRTGTLSSTQSIVQRFPEGDCWVIITNTGSWRGFNFSRDLIRLIEQLRSRYSGSLPRQNLWK